MSSSTQESSGKQRAALSRELSEFLMGFSIAVHRFQMYPGDHPSLIPTTENVMGGLAGLLQDRRSLSLGIGQRQLVINNVPTDERHPVLSDLARRLHDHHLAALTFDRGVEIAELKELFQALSEETDRDGKPVGLLPEEEQPRWERIHLYPIGYDHLEFGGEGKEVSQSRSRQLWLGLAQAALRAAEGDMDPDAPPDGRAVAREIEQRSGEGGYDQVVVGYLLQLAEEMKGAQGAEWAELRARISELIQELDEDTLQRMIRFGGGSAETKRFVHDANKGGLPVDVVIKVLEATASLKGQSVYSSPTRLLSKLSLHAEKGARNIRADAASAIRESVEKLITRWELDDPIPDAYTQILDRISKAVPALEPEEGEEDETSGSERIVQMALEVDAYGPTLRKAVSELLDAGEMTRLLAILDEAPEGSEVADRIRHEVMTPTQLKRILAGEDVDEEGLRLLVQRIGPAAVDLLFEYLMTSESRSVRRKIFDCLARMKDGSVAEKAMEYLEDERWFVQRNMLSLLQQMETLPEGFSAQRYIQHADPRVRQEAFPLAIRDPVTRAHALTTALGDQNERIARMALLEFQEGISETMVPVVVNRIIESDTFPQLRSLAARTLVGSRSQLALNTLLSLCSGGRTFFGRRKLAEKSPELLAALGVLAQEWQSDSRAEWALKLARGSEDPQIRAAATPRSAS